MKTIMWIQSDSAGGSDLFYVDGYLVNDEISMMAANKILMRAQESRYQNIKLMKRLQIETGSPNFTLAYAPSMGFLYKSVFNEKASDGRLKAFVLWCVSSEKKNVWEIAKSISAKTPFTIRDNEHQIIQTYLGVLNKMLTGTIICACISIALILLLAYANK